MKRFTKKVVALAVGVQLTLQPLYAQNGNEETMFGESSMVSLASMYLEPMERASGIVDVITAEEIKQAGVRDLNDVFDRLPGMESRASQMWFHNPAFRGINDRDGTKVRYMIDGVGVNDLMAGSASIAYSDMSLSEVERIEIIRGPGSALYGEHAMLGVVNIITKKAHHINGVQASLRGGSFKNKGGSLLMGKVFGNVGLSFATDYFNSDGYKKPVEKDLLFGAPFAATPGETGTMVERSQHSAKLSAGGLDLNLRHLDYRKQALVGVTRVITPGEGNVAHVRDNIASLHYTKQAGALSVEPYIDYLRRSTDMEWMLFPKGFIFTIPTPFGPMPIDTDGDGDFEIYPEGVKGRPGTKNSRVTLGLKTEYTGLSRHRILTGVSYIYAKQFDTYNETNFDPLSFAYQNEVLTRHTNDGKNWNVDTTREVGSVFLQDKIMLLDGIALTLGGRYDNYSDVGDSFNPRVSVVWSPTPNLDLKALYGSAFRAPSFVELHNTNNPAEIGNPDLKPEKIKTYEAAVYYRPSTINASLIGVNVFYNDIMDLIEVRTAGPVLQWKNAVDLKTYGVEAEYRVKPMSILDIRTSYSYVDGEHTDKTPLTDISHHKVTGEVNIQPQERLNWNLSAVYQSGRDRNKGDLRPAIKGHALVNTTVSYAVSENLGLSLSVYNVFDKDYVTADTSGQIPGDFPRVGKDVRAQATYKF